MSIENTYFYDRPVCTGLGDRVGALMTLFTLSQMYHVDIYFRWCEDPSVIYQNQRQYMPKWYGFNYSLSEFQKRFWNHTSVHIFTEQNMSMSLQTLNNMAKVQFQNNEVPSEAGLDHVYTTASKTTKVYKFQDNENFIQNYRVAARKFYLYALKQNFKIMAGKQSRYIVIHMRLGDLNTYTPYLGSHDHPRVYCTTKVVRKVLQALDSNIQAYVISNNETWAKAILANYTAYLKFVSPKYLNKPLKPSSLDNDDYNDFALLLGAAGIIQHANYGWSSFSNNPAMIANVPLITTYKPTNQHFRFNIFRSYGSLPTEFHDCYGISSFIDKIQSQRN